MDKLAIQDKALSIIKAEEQQKQFVEMLGERAPHFIASISALLAEQPKLAACTPQSINIAAMKGAALDLSFDPSLGEAYMMPFKKSYKDEHGQWQKIQEAIFIPGYKGLIQLALRTGQYVKLNALPVTNRMWRHIRERLDESADPTKTVVRFFEAIDFYTELQGGKVEGYLAYFELTNGFRKFVYWDSARTLKHGRKFSPSFNEKAEKFYDGSAWVTNEEAMCLKTVIRQLLGKWGPKSKEMRTVLEQDNRESVLLLQEEIRPALSNGSVSDGNEDNDLFGEDPEKKTPTPEEVALDAAYTAIQKLWEKYGINDHERRNSCAKHFGNAVLENCQDVEKLTVYLELHKKQYWSETVGRDKIIASFGGKSPELKDYDAAIDKGEWEFVKDLVAAASFEGISEVAPA
jgi:recombination protein RecT